MKVGTIEGAAAKLKINGIHSTTLEVFGLFPSVLGTFEMTNTEEAISGPTVIGAGQIAVTTSFVASYGAYMIGKGSLVLEEGATGLITNGKAISLELEKEWRLENKGTLRNRPKTLG